MLAWTSFYSILISYSADVFVLLPTRRWGSVTAVEHLDSGKKACGSGAALLLHSSEQASIDEDCLINTRKTIKGQTTAWIPSTNKRQSRITPLALHVCEVGRRSRRFKKGKAVPMKAHMRRGVPSCKIRASSSDSHPSQDPSTINILRVCDVSNDFVNSQFHRIK